MRPGKWVGRHPRDAGAGGGWPHAPSQSTRAFADLTIAGAIDRYVSDLQAEMSPRVIASLRASARPLSAFFGERCLRTISLTDLIGYQHARRIEGRASKTVNSELSVLLQLLEHGKLWRHVAEGDGPVLTGDEQARLFEIARSRASTLAPSLIARAPTDGERATCPCCGGATLAFRRRHVLLSGRSGRDKHGAELNRLRYAQGWACDNGACGYRRLTNCRTDVLDML
jgi:hypothetical protein